MNIIKEFDKTLDSEDCAKIIKSIDSLESYNDWFHWKGLNDSGDSLLEFLNNKALPNIEEFLKATGGLLKTEHIECRGFSATRQAIGFSDVLHYDLESVVGFRTRVRPFVAIFYLDEGFEGGQLVFPTLNRVVEPKAGKLALFPTSYFLPHLITNTSKAERHTVILHYAIKDSHIDRGQEWGIQRIYDI